MSAADSQSANEHTSAGGDGTLGTRAPQVCDLMADDSGYLLTDSQDLGKATGDDVYTITDGAAWEPLRGGREDALSVGQPPDANGFWAPCRMNRHLIPGIDAWQPERRIVSTDESKSVTDCTVSSPLATEPSSSEANRTASPAEIRRQLWARRTGPRGYCYWGCPINWLFK